VVGAPEADHIHDAAEVDLNKRIPFGPMRKDDGPITTVGHCEIWTTSSVSKFRSRFKAVIVSGSDHRKGTDQYDDLRLRESALRSGVQGSSFDDDLRHHAEDVLLMDPTLGDSPGTALTQLMMSTRCPKHRNPRDGSLKCHFEQDYKKELSPRSSRRA
jgi:hypothetical protein